MGVRKSLILFGGQVDGNLRTSNPDVYAVGDIAAFPLKKYGITTRQVTPPSQFALYPVSFPLILHLSNALPEPYVLQVPDPCHVDLLISFTQPDIMCIFSHRKVSVFNLQSKMVRCMGLGPSGSKLAFDGLSCRSTWQTAEPAQYMQCSPLWTPPPATTTICPTSILESLTSGGR